VSVEKIPIENIYFLLCYAWNHAQETHFASVRTESCDRVWDLLAKVLARGTQQLVKRGLHRDYVPHRESLARPRGKILVSEDLRRPRFGSLARSCEYDELNGDILPNRIIRSAIDLLSGCEQITEANAATLREVAGYFAAFEPVRLEGSAFRRLQVNRQMRHYRFILNVCEFIYRQSLPMEDGGAHRFRDFRRDDALMGALFEQFVRNFYQREQSTYSVSAPHVDWNVDEDKSTLGGLELLPRMRTDIMLASPGNHLIIDCKFYAEAFQRYRGSKSFRSGHLYQMIAYLKNQACESGWENVRGLLLYPTVDEAFDETVHVEGHSIRFAALDLNQSWQHLSEALLALLRLNSMRSSSVH
jgi:5-methylcytosine-specific restriction enzyme subunit McrC